MASVRIDNRSLSRYLAEIGRLEPLKPEREVELTLRIKKGDLVAKNELVKANLRFVVSTAKKYQGNGLPLTDIINEGNIGLIKAAGRFDETRGFKFISYAVWWIRQSILQALAENNRMVRLPLNQIGSITKLTRAAEKLEAELERTPDADEIGRQLEMKSTAVIDCMQISRKHQSLDAPFRESENASLLNVITYDGDLSTEDPMMEESLKKEVELVLDTLSDREQKIIKFYFGIGQSHSFTLHEIGEVFNLTRERIRQIKELALRRLRHKSRCNVLRPYLG